MVEAGGGGGAPGCGSRSKPTSSFESADDRLRFTLELRPGETTIVSWKKLLKEATSSKSNGPAPSVPDPSSEGQILQHPPHPPTLAVASSLKQPNENEWKDAQGTNRLSNVIERIERMYAGNGSSDDEDVGLDDDQYDTEDSFIDDAELDDYFQVDNSEIKHDGFFVNRGKLERIEPTVSTNQHLKKRRRKDITKSNTASDSGHNSNKHVKLGNKGRKTSTPVERSSVSQSQRGALANVHSAGVLLSPLSAGEVVPIKRIGSTKFSVEPVGMSNGDGIKQYRDADQLKTEVPLSRNYNNKLKEYSDLQDIATQRSNDKHISKSHSGNQLIKTDVLDQSIDRKEKSGHIERFDLNVPASRDSLPVTKVPLTQRKEGSSARPKTSTLDKAIRELEKIIAESRPPSQDVQDPDNSSQAVKRRLSPEIKQKLAKVARVTQTTYGKIPKDLINRLMSILGHLMQVRTLKRNLKVMASMGLSAKQEKDEHMQKIKQEVTEMVKLRIPYIKSKIGQQTANSGDFQEACPEEKEALKRKHCMDEPLENKICDLYDLCMERAEEDSGPPVRRLYEELAALWPSGVMDANGIKRAICRAKDRRRSLGNRKRDQERIRKKKALTPKELNPNPEEANDVVQAVPIHAKLLSDSRDHDSSSTVKPLLPGAVSQTVAELLAPFSNGPNMDKPKRQKIKESSSSSNIDVILKDILPKKKLKQRPQNVEVVESQYGHEKPMVSQAEDRHKHHKHVAGSVPKSSL